MGIETNLLTLTRHTKKLYPAEIPRMRETRRERTSPAETINCPEKTRNAVRSDENAK